MYFIRLFVNDWKTPNEIKQLTNYEPFTCSRITKATFVMNESRNDICGCYITNYDSELLFYQKFEQRISVQRGDKISVDFQKELYV